MKTIQFQDTRRKNDELEDLVGRLHDLSVRDREYAMLHARCESLFPNAMLSIPKPGYRDAPPSVAYSYQATAPPPLTPQPWSMQTSAPAPVPAIPPASTSTPTSFFPPRPKTCAFCHGQGHRIRSCPIASEYLASGRTSVIEGRIHLPNGQPVPFDGSR